MSFGAISSGGGFDGSTLPYLWYDFQTERIFYSTLYNVCMCMLLSFIHSILYLACNIFFFVFFFHFFVAFRAAKDDEQHERLVAITKLAG